MLKTTRRRTWEVGTLIEAVKVSTSKRQVLMRLGLKEAGGNYSQIQKYINELKLDVSHFTGPGWNRGLSGLGKPRWTLEQILVKDSHFQSYKVRNKLFNAGLKPKQCEECGWAKKSSDGRLPLELEHINGERTDNRINNLKILCPNCHSLTLTYRRRKKK